MRASCYASSSSPSILKMDGAIFEINHGKWVLQSESIICRIYVRANPLEVCAHKTRLTLRTSLGNGFSKNGFFQTKDSLRR